MSSINQRESRARRVVDAIGIEDLWVYEKLVDGWPGDGSFEQKVEDFAAYLRGALDLPERLSLTLAAASLKLVGAKSDPGKPHREKPRPGRRDKTLRILGYRR